MTSIPGDGIGMYPALHYPLFLLIHAITLTGGYVGFTFVFSYTLGMIFLRQMDGERVRLLRPIIVVSWFLLVASILAGSRWAYLIKGWGGYWSWDVIENVSLLPLFFSTAYLHSVIVQEKRGMLKIWNLFLISSTYISILFATYVSRSSSFKTDHSFSHSSSAPYFLFFLLISFLLILIMFLRNRKWLKSDNHLESLLSREASFLFNNLLLLGASFVILWGILLPVLSEVMGKAVSVGPIFYRDCIMLPGLLLIFLTGFCPLLAWKKTSFSRLKRNIIVPSILSFCLGGVFYVSLGLDQSFLFFICLLSAFVIVTIVFEVISGLKVQENVPFLSAFYSLLRKNQRKYGGYTIHLGTILVLCGFVFSGYTQTKKVTLNQGDFVTMEDYQVGFESISDEYTTVGSVFTLTMNLLVKKGEKVLGILNPTVEFHTDQSPYSRTAVFSTFFLDVSARWDSLSTSDGKAAIVLKTTPFAQLIWIGAGILFVGTFIALFPNRRKKNERIKFFSVLVPFLGVLFFTPGLVTADESVSSGRKVEGRVVVKEASDNLNLEGITVYLQSHENANLKPLQTITDSKGEFVFDDLSGQERVSYLVTARYEGIMFGSDFFTFGRGVKDVVQEVFLELFHSVTDKSSVSVELHTVVIDVDILQRSFFITENILLNNPGKKVYKGYKSLYHDRREVMRIELPDGYQNLVFQRGLAEHSTFMNDRGILDTTPIKPGKKAVEFSYTIPFNLPEQKISRNVYFKTKNIKILFKNTGLAIQSSILDFYGIAVKDEERNKGGSRGQLQDDYYYIMTKKNLEADTVFSVFVAGFPEKNKIPIVPITYFSFGLLTFIAVVQAKKDKKI